MVTPSVSISQLAVNPPPHDEWAKWRSQCEACLRLPTNRCTASAKIRDMLPLLEELSKHISRFPKKEADVYDYELALFEGTLGVLERASEARIDPDHWLHFGNFCSQNQRALTSLKSSDPEAVSKELELGVARGGDPTSLVMQELYSLHFKMAEALLKGVLKHTEQNGQLTLADVVENIRSARKELGDFYEGYFAFHLQALKDNCTSGRSLEKLLSKPWLAVIAHIGAEGADPALAPVDPETFREVLRFWLLMSPEAQKACLKHLIEDYRGSSPDALKLLCSSNPFQRQLLDPTMHPHFLESKIGRGWNLVRDRVSELRFRVWASRFPQINWDNLSLKDIAQIAPSIPPKELESYLGSLTASVGPEIVLSIKNALGIQQGEASRDLFERKQNGDMARRLVSWATEEEDDPWALLPSWLDILGDDLAQLLNDSLPIQTQDEEKESSVVKDLRMQDPDSDLSKIVRGEPPKGLERQPLLGSTSSQKLTEIQNSLKSDLSRHVAKIKESAWTIIKNAIESGRVAGAKIAVDEKDCLLFDGPAGKKIKVFFDPQIKQVAWVDAKRNRNSSVGPEITDASFRLVGQNGEEMGAVDLAFFLGWTDNLTGRYLYTKVSQSHPLPTLLRNLAQVASGHSEGSLNPPETVIKTTHLTQIVPGVTEEVGEDNVPKSCGTMGYFLFRQYRAQPTLRMAFDSSGAMIFIAITDSAGTEAIYCQKDGQEHWAYLASDQTKGDIRTNLASSHVIDEVNAIGQKIANDEKLTEEEQDTYAKFFEGIIQVLEVPLISKEAAKIARAELQNPQIRALNARWEQFHIRLNQVFEAQINRFLRIADLTKMGMWVHFNPSSSNRNLVPVPSPDNKEEINAMLEWLQGPLVTSLCDHLQNRRYDLILQAIQNTTTLDERRTVEALHDQITEMLQPPPPPSSGGHGYYDRPAGGWAPFDDRFAGAPPSSSPMGLMAHYSAPPPSTAGMGGMSYFAQVGGAPAVATPMDLRYMVAGMGPSGAPPSQPGGAPAVAAPTQYPQGYYLWHQRGGFGPADSSVSQTRIGAPPVTPTSVMPGARKPSEGYSLPVVGSIQRASHEAVLARMYAGPQRSSPSSKVSEATNNVLEPLKKCLKEGYTLDLRNITMISLEVLLAEGPHSLTANILADRFLRQLPAIFKACLETSKTGETATKRAIDGH